MNNGQDRPKAPAREMEPVRVRLEARGTAEAAPRRPVGAPGAGAKRQSGGNATAGGSGRPRRRKLHPALSALLWTLRLTIVPLLCIAALIAGLYIGYTKLGGGSSGDVWRLETWLHMLDLIFAES